MAALDHAISRRTLLGGLAGGAAATLLAACGSSGGSSGGSTGPSGTSGSTSSGGSSGSTTANASGTLSFMSWDSEEVMAPTIKAFEAQYPHVSVQTSYVPPVTQYISTLQERLLAGTGPDVFIYTDENRSALNAHKFVRNLSDQPWVADMAKANKEFMSADGGVWGLSPASWTAGPIYNLDLLHKAGYKSTPATWSDFLKLCGALKDQKVTPLYDAVPPPGSILQGLIGGYYASHFGKNVDAEIFDRKLTFTQAWTEPLTAYDQLYSQRLVSSANLGLTGTEIDTLMATGKLGIYGSGPWDVATIRADNPKVNLLMGEAPGLASGKGYWCGSANEGWAVNSKANNPTAALAFLSFLASTAGLKVYMAKEGYPCTMTNYSAPMPSALTEAAVAARESKFYFTATSWPSQYEPQLAAVLTAQLESMIEGKTSVSGVLSALDSELDKLLKSS